MVKVRNIKVSAFQKRAATEKIVCICAGQDFRELCEKCPQMVGQIQYVIDNYRKERQIWLGSRAVPVLSMGEMPSDIKDALVVVTSLQYAEEIIRQLDGLEQWDGMEVYVPALFWADDDKLVLTDHDKQRIPKKIHYCWFGKSRIPERFQRNIESWKRILPDYEICRWDESNYDYTKNRYMRQAYEAGKWGFVPDYARLDLINTYGGIYLDTDVEVVRPLDVFLQYELFCGFQDVWSINFGLGFGGVSDHPILCDMMEGYERTLFVTQDGTLNLTASPVYQTKVLEKYGLIRNGSSQRGEHFAAFSMEYFSPIHMYGMGNITEKTYSVHQYAGTWFGEAQRRTREKVNASVAFVMGRICEDD